MNRSKWILLAEDNENDVELALHVLTSHRSVAEVFVASDGLEALDRLHQSREVESGEAGLPALVLLDLKMPKVDGLEVLRQVKNDSGLSHIPVVVFTSSREESDLRRSYQLGANAYVVKPVDFHDFNAALQHISAFWIATNEPPPGANPAAASTPKQHVQSS